MPLNETPSTSYVTSIMVAVFVIILLGAIYYMTRAPKKEKAASEESSGTDGFDVAAEVDKLRKKQDLYKSS